MHLCIVCRHTHHRYMHHRCHWYAHHWYAHHWHAHHWYAYHWYVHHWYAHHWFAHHWNHCMMHNLLSWYMHVWCIINVPRSLTLIHVCMMPISIVLDLDPEACIYVWFLTLVYVCMCDAYICSWSLHMWPWCTYLSFKCMMHLSRMLDPDTSMYDAYIYVPRSLTLMSDICDTGPWSWSMHVCMMHLSMFLDPRLWLWLWFLIHLTMMHICMMQLAMILNPDTCMYDA